MANRLIEEKSPYLLQHAHNPVDWLPWGEEAFRKAAAEDKPVFLSIGYSTCHWCHVMERESFEDEEMARLLNEHVVSIKVDREERPDVDSVYMTVCQALTGSGGWPLSIFMTPDRKPFFAGTYFPKHGRMGMPGLVDIISHVSDLWKNNREQVLRASEEITGAIQPRRPTGKTSALDRGTLEKAYRQLEKSFDAKWGGFGGAPKFPTPHRLTFLLRWMRRSPESSATEMVEKTLDAMRDGGLFDQIGFGFHRYSVDEKWLVPHFEKMLYDQALLAMAYTEAFQATGRERHGRVAGEIFEYVLRDMTDPRGGFYSGEDADSEDEEGRFYVWRPEEVVGILGKSSGDLFCRYFNITSSGNFEHRTSIPHIVTPAPAFADANGMEVEELESLIEEGRQKLFAARKTRVHPFKDDKVLTSWNSLMIVALAKGYQALRDRAYLEAATNAADFILDVMRRDSGTLYRRYRQGEVAHHGYLDDYAFFSWALLELYESTFDVRYLEEALRTAEAMVSLFQDERDGGFFYTARDVEDLIVRDKELYDGAIPSSNSVAGLVLLRLARMTGDAAWEQRAEKLFQAFACLVGDYPSAYTQFLNALDFALGPSREIVIAGASRDPATEAMVDVIYSKFAPNRVVMLREEGEKGRRLAALSEYVAPFRQGDDGPAAYICESYACKQPITDVEILEATIS